MKSSFFTIPVITNLMKRFNFKQPKKILGRWNIDECNLKINRKIDYSNEDHCGPCGTKEQLNEKISTIISKKDIHVK